MLRLDGKIAFISGMGSVGEGWGNGRATAVLMARQGATVFGTDVNIAAAEATVATIHAGGTAARRTARAGASGRRGGPRRSGW